MTLSVTPIGDNPSLPSVAAETYIPDQLIAGALKLVTATVNITGGALLQRGTVLGMITEGSEGLTGSTVYASGTVGNGTLGSISFGEEASQGAYVVRFETATTYKVITPEGVELASVGSNQFGPQSGMFEIGFTFTAGGTAMVAGDEIVILATGGAGSFKLSKSTARDGSQNPSAILVDQVDASQGDQNGAIYQMGEFNGNAIIYDSSWTVAQLTGLLRRWGIFIKTPVTALDPTTSSGGAMGGDAGGVVS